MSELGINGARMNLASKDGSQFMMPFALGTTLLFGGAAIAEILSKGAFDSPDTISEIYFAIMAAYAGAGEVKGWRQSRLANSVPGGVAGEEPSDTADPWLERARKGGIFVGFWLSVYGLSYILRLFNSSYAMPKELKGIVISVISLFFATYSIRSVRRAIQPRLSVPRVSDESIYDWLRVRQEPATMQALEARFTDVPRRTLTRQLGKLIDEKRIVREGHPNSPDNRYRLA